jgi:ABC-type glycerol-3-phosphate transport system substrate-binding protein
VPRYMRKSVVMALVMVGLLGLFIGPVSAQKKVIRYWSYGGRPCEEPLRRIIARFEAEHPDVSVELQMFGDWGDIHQKTLIALAGGEPPDVTRVKPLNVTDFAIRGALLPLDSYVERDTIDLEELPPVLLQ